MKRFCSLLTTLALAVAAGRLPTAVRAAATEPYGLNAMLQFERLPYLKLDTTAGGQSSFDRAGNNGDYNNFLYTNGTEKVLLDMYGPGTVYRLWFTGFTAATDYLKIYFDGETTPRVNLLLEDMFAGTNAPWLSPLVGNDLVSSGGFYCYLPLPFARSIKITSNGTSDLFYYNIGYHLYSQDTVMATWTGGEDSSAVRNLWNNAGTDPKNTAGNTTVSNTFNLSPAGTQVLLDVPGPGSISAIKMRIPGTEPPAPPPFITDDGRAFTGSSQFKVKINPANSGVTLTRRLDFGIGNQTANVSVDGSLVGQWSTPGSDETYHWRNSSFNIPTTYTASKSTITITVTFVSSDVDWNEFYYWVYSSANGTNVLTDSVDVGNTTSESSHSYVINTQTWEGTRTFQYPLVGAGADLLTNLWLSIAFDDETNPSVLAPIGAFFAMGQFSSYFTRALPVGMDASSNFYCYFPMPFARRATVQLVSQLGRPTTNIQCAIAYKPFLDSFTNVGYFKTQFRSETPTTNGLDIVLLDTEGGGHLVGVVESMMGPLSRGYLEGNERFYVDDSHSPAISGTGTEDFYNAGWYFDQGTFTLPTHGNPVHLTDTNFDYTTAYRLFMQDAVPFRKHILAGIEHGPVDDVPINVWTLAYYYYQPMDRAVLTDQLQLGNSADETAHNYSINTPTWSGSRTFTYEWQGNFTSLVLTNTGRADQGYSQFTLALPPTNAGVILRRQLDQGIASQQADIYVDGVLVGPWYQAGGNIYHRWRDDDFMIPASYTSGKSSVQIRVQFVSSTVDWNEFNYSLYTLEPAALAATNQARFAGWSWTGRSGSSPFVLALTGATNANYDVWGSTNLLSWNWLGTAARRGPGAYAFTDAPAAWPQRFYRVVGP